MKYFYNFPELPFIDHSVITIGMFDGVHLGHAKVLTECVKIAKLKGIASIVISFSNHPSSYFNPKHDSKNSLLSPDIEKIEWIEKLGIDYLFMIPFDHYIAHLPAESFIEDILLTKFGISDLVLGYDNHFGFQRKGSVDFVNEHYSSKIQAYSIEVAKLDEEIISSSTIKEYVIQGNISKANTMLGRAYSLQGKVIHGNHKGRELGFPTANIELNDTDKLIPGLGVYISTLKVNNQLVSGLTNIGKRPTLTQDAYISIETHLFDFQEDIYGKEVELYLVDKIREEKKFNSLQELILQISSDVQFAKSQLAKIHITS
ncbi:bifunctional riboflavin kinase/FAD synthetase [Aquirufa aurantiipilula]|uniref:Riboflavin biosynthesis protein n=1 Tax=Aquirufa aurantiipilula TaxID=2696561 RepID=A0ABT6BH18_9BACT|nr:bifunctional riboflavin kinase/FAD synthetase [Aquirufa aurantiipilula]MDF5689752.1 bifunctional riboflavin kinase/FAD synthetase [Aquirufa aurantiipilula]